MKMTGDNAASSSCSLLLSKSGASTVKEKLKN